MANAQVFIIEHQVSRQHYTVSRVDYVDKLFTQELRMLAG
jgi:hypothetical protein